MSDANVYDDPQRRLKVHEASRVVFDSYWRSKTQLVDKKRPLWKEWAKAYHSFIEIEDDDVFTHLFLPLIYSHVEIFLPRLIASRPRIQVWPREPGDVKRASAHRVLANLHWDTLRMPMKSLLGVKGAEIFGAQWFKTYYRKEVHTRTVRRRQLESMLSVVPILGGRAPFGFVKEERDVVLYDGPFTSCLEIDEVFPDPDGKVSPEVTGSTTCKWIVHRSLVSLSEIKAARKDGKPLYDPRVVAELEKRIRKGNTRSATETKTVAREVREVVGLESTQQTDPHKRDLHLLEYWTDDKVIVCVEEHEGLEPIRHERNEMGVKPFDIFTPIPVPGELYGKAIPEVLFALNLEMNQLHNVRMDHMMQTVHQMYTYILGSPFNPASVVFRPRGWIGVGSHEDLKPLPTNEVTFATYRESEYLRQFAEFAAATDTAAGVQTDAKTATEAALLAQASGSKAQLMFRIFAEQTLAEIGRKWMRVDELYLTQDRFHRIAGAEFTADNPEQGFEPILVEDLLSGSGLDLDYVISVAETEPETRQFRLQRAISALQVLGGLGLPLQHPVMERMFIQVLEGFNVERADLAVAQGRQIIAQAQAAAQAEQQGAPPQAVTPADQLASQAGGEAPSQRTFV